MTTDDYLHIRIDDELALKLLVPNQAPVLFQLVNQSREHLREWLPWLDYTRSVKDSEAFIRESIKQFFLQESLVMGIWWNGELAGLISLQHIHRANQMAEIGYWLGQRFVGHGIMTRSCEALVDYAFQTLKLNRVTIKAAVGNTGSQSVPNRLGFQIEGCMREAEWLYDRYVDHQIFGMLARDWKQKS